LSLPYDPERVILQVACTDYEVGSNLVAGMLANMAKIAGVEPNPSSGQTDPAFGWTFYTLSIDKAFVLRLAGLPGNDIMRMKGSTLDQKFSVWLNNQLQTRTEGVRVQPLSDLKSSQFGLF
jgi:hypothetical protein